MGWIRQDGQSRAPRRRAPRIAVAAMAVFATMASLLMVVASPVVEEAEAADASGFQSGLIVSDANFYDGGAMSASQVQSFLDGQMRQCASGYTCLRGYAQSTPTMAANAYCGAIQGQGSESAASIIARIGAACNISQRFLLVLLQKEQSLVTSTAPVQRQYDRATGFACPDTAPCDSSYGGFFYQVYYAARQFNVYKRFPTSYNHQPAAWNNVLFHPNAACGSSRVYIQNSATAGLYNYTPYQPNGAALGNLYGTGDGCSSYGNRNTWRMWTDWFGDPSRAQAAAFMRNASTGQIFLVANGRKHYVGDPSLFTDFVPLYVIETRDASYLDALPTGANLSNVVRSTSGAVYLVRAGVRYYFRSCADIQAWGYSCGDSAYLSDDQMTRLQAGGDVEMTVRASDGTNWLVQSGSRRQLSDLDLPPQFGYSTRTLALAPNAIAHLPVGAPVIGQGDVVRSADYSQYRLQASTGTWSVPGATIGLRFLWFAPVFTAESLRLLPASAGTLPIRFADSSGAYVIADSGILRVRESEYGGLPFTRVPDGTGQSLPATSAAATAPHFATEYGGDGRWYLVANGTRAHVQNMDWYRQIQAQQGVPSTVWVVARGVLDGIPERSSYSDGTLVRGPSGAVYLMSGGNGIHVASMDIVSALGLSTSITEVSQSIINGLASRTGVLNDYGIQCNGVSYLAANGQLMPYASAAVRAEWGRTDIALGSLCSRLTISSQAAGVFAYDQTGRTYMADDGALRYIDSAATYASVNGTSDRVRITRAGALAIGQGPWVRPVYRPGALVSTPGRSEVWIVDGTTLRHLGSFATSTSMGLGTANTQVPNEAIASYGQWSTLPTSLVVCGSTAYVASGGRLLPMSAQVRAQFPASAFTSLSGALCGAIPVGSQATQLIRGTDGRVYWVENGQRHWLGGAALQRLGGSNPQITAVDATVLGAIPVGATWTQ
ncbi:hypothetical protein [Agrococcus jejuensis]|uniref:Uncharacterized protein n=1 Tax=Agrococcus jejuensis TaxID=399736 RepID=A0A1G8FI72_9MICO|nr:hypothetical protein [Agrococcus jejuensis]SDH81863.1 hypothetical protein SAMN04489720_2487 [Agrococcus jejuensis]